MEKYNVTGMSCAACSARVEKAVAQVPGVNSCSVNLLTNSMGVEGTAASEDIINAVIAAGYGASLKGREKNNSIKSEDELKDTETPKMKRRLIASILVLIPLMYVSMGHMMWNWPLPEFMKDNHLAMGIYEMLLAGLVMVINQKFFINGFKGLINKSPNMDTLVALGSAASFIYSTFALFAMTVAIKNGDSNAVSDYMNEFYFESAAMILTLITVGKMLEARSKGKTTDALKGLMKLAPKTATVLVDGNEKELPIEEIKVGDTFTVRPGEAVPVDGIIVSGESAINEASLTGESIPVDKKPGDSVSTATINQSGYLICTATRVGEDTTLSQIIQMVSDASATKAPIAKVADRVSGIFVPVVMGIALFTFIVWMVTGQTIGFSLARAISVLVISCPCALGLATPVAIMVGNGVGARKGILFKTAASLEETGKAQIVVLDKTGTITCGQPKVNCIVTYDGTVIQDNLAEKGPYAEELIKIAYSLERKSEHPLSKAIVEFAKQKEFSFEEINDFQAVSGNGLKALINGDECLGGNLEFVSAKVKIDKCILEQANEFAGQGKTPLFFSKGKQFLGMIVVSDVLKNDSPQAIKELKNLGIRVLMLTGDNKKTAEYIGRLAGVDEVVAGVRPEGKEAVIEKLTQKGKVIMVGDGINDAPALTRADMGIAIGAGTDIAIDAADVVLMKSSISDLVAAIRISRATLRNIHENLFWAFFYNIIGIPLAAGLWIPIFGWTLNPMFGAAAMSLSSFCVVTNALRLNFIKVYDSKKDKKIKNALQEKRLIEEAYNEEQVEMENNTMKLKVNGMMCGHCEAHVKKALEKLDGITTATADHKTGTVELEITSPISEEVLKNTITEEGYEFVGII